MPSSLGHVLGGAAVAWTADLVPGRRAWRTARAPASWYRRAGNGLTLICATLGAIPDADLVFRIHRTYSHSIGAVIFVGLFAAAMAAYARRPIVRVGLMCAGAYGSHLVLDWMGADATPPYGIQALWPFTDAWYISGWDVFRQTDRLHLLTREGIVGNLLALAQEIAILLPIAALVWAVRKRMLKLSTTEDTEDTEEES